MIQIAIDGFSGSGKGELCKGLAEKFQLKHLDTGAILRAIGLYFFRLGILNPTKEDIDAHEKNFNIKIEFDGKKQITFLNGEDVSKEIRQEKIGAMASKVAVYQKAMKILIDIAQTFAKKYNCIMDGRNITSEVLPDADVKFFLTANLETRATRRHNEAISRGQQSNYDEVLKSLQQRDKSDTTREFSAMVQTPDSILIDNTKLSISETIELCAKIVEEKLKASGKIK